VPFHGRPSELDLVKRWCAAPEAPGGAVEEARSEWWAEPVSNQRSLACESASRLAGRGRLTVKPVDLAPNSKVMALGLPTPRPVGWVW